MKPLVKAIIVVLIAAGVVIPAGYYSISVFQNKDVSLTQLVPGNSTLVVRAVYNNTQMYAFNSSNTDGVVIGVSMAAFSSQISSAENTTNTSGPKIEPVLYSTYRGYSIYSISNVSLKGLVPAGINTSQFGTNLSLDPSNYLGDNNTVYLADLTGIVSLGSFTAVKYSLDAYLDGKNFQAFAEANFNATANVSLYFTSPTAPVQQAISNVYYLKSTFSVEMNNQSNTVQLSKGLSAVNLLANNFTVSNSIDGNWVNGTITVGIGNYYLIQDFIANLPAGNYSQLLSGFSP